MMEARLTDGDRVCIIGGGPAGSFAALHLTQFARRRGLNLDIIIFEPRNQLQKGAGGCKGCAGILSSRLLSEMESLGLTLSQNVIQSELHSYSAHVNGRVIEINQPDPSRKIVSVYRGCGPRLADGNHVSSFDSTLLKLACSRGARHIPCMVREVRCGEPPTIVTDEGETWADLVVLANGVNSTPPLPPAYSYQPPQTETMRQDEMIRPTSWPEDRVGVFFRNAGEHGFAALVPKGPYMGISLLGDSWKKDHLEKIARGNEARSADSRLVKALCGCMPRIAVSPARNYYGDRWVAVGDAAATRLYKDGIGSACMTAKVAMQTAVEHGLSSSDFREYYAPQINAIGRDNRYGQLLMKLWYLTLRMPVLLNAWQNAIFREASLHPTKQLHARILWGMITGDEHYKDLFSLFLRGASIKRLCQGLYNIG
jgi:flavin-dependent dehydrogenase